MNGIILENDEMVLVKPKIDNLDSNGGLAKSYFEILHSKGVSEDVRLGVFGYASISPFLPALKETIDIIPNLFIVGGACSGKTTMLELLINKLYGTHMISPDYFDSLARFHSIVDESSFPLINIDEINILDGHVLKSMASRKGTRVRMTSDQVKPTRVKDVCFTCSSTSGKEAFGEITKRRNLILETSKRVLFEDENFYHHRNEILNGKVFGYYLLEKSIEFINDEFHSDSAHLNLIDLIGKTRACLFGIVEGELSDIRRLTIHSLIYIGLQFWQHVFEANGLKSELLESVLDLKSGKFHEFMITH